MYTIKQAAQRSGVSSASLRAWERRYGVVRPQRTESGYRLYDDDAIATLAAMRRLVEDGWTAATAAAAVSAGEAPQYSTLAAAAAAVPAGEGADLRDDFLAAADAVDVGRLESVLDQAFSLGSFETVADDWLMPTLRALGEAWATGRVDVAGEHAASQCVMRRLSMAFAGAASLSRGPRVVVGLPSGSHHELGTLAFATALRRRGVTVVYVGADLPGTSWQRAVRAFPSGAAVLGVPTADDRGAAGEAAAALRSAAPGLVVAAGGRHGRALAPGVVSLPDSITESARVVETLVA
jgi:DNA-binding transcriptional MerR regulator/methylmalonyl-CoA mutase cobalamin-binding subunit